VISTKAVVVVKVLERAKLLGVRGTRLGTVGGDKLEIKSSGATLSLPVAELYDLWWHAIARHMA
jgi:hypothetical protein